MLCALPCNCVANAPSTLFTPGPDLLGRGLCTLGNNLILRLCHPEVSQKFKISKPLRNIWKTNYLEQYTGFNKLCVIFLFPKLEDSDTSSISEFRYAAP